jgi:hypothetical protein
MALIGKISIAMGVQTAGLQKGLRTASIEIKQFSNNVNVAALALTGFAVAGTAMAAAGIAKMVSAGSDLVESQNAVTAVFGENTAVVNKFNDNMAIGFGSSKTELLGAEQMLGGIFKNLGYSTSGAADLSVQFVKLATDLSSFKNLKFEDALNKIRSGITGESEPLKSIGILINEAAVKSEAMALGT